jgi:serine/threonine protein phosphatase 1
MSGRKIAIGDIHGCSQALEALIRVIDPAPEDLIVPLGDYVDRGPDSRGVIEQMIELVDRCEVVPLLGNHELMLLGAIDAAENISFWLQCGGAETLASYGDDLSNIPQFHLAFLRGCRRYHETEGHIFVHANYDPRLSLDEQPDGLLFWEHLMMRPNGTHTIPPRHRSGKVAIVGHSPQSNGEILDLGDVICIDTYCVGDGWLTALEVETGQVWQADQLGNLREK